MAEISLVNARKSSLAADAKKGSKTAGTALKLIRDPNKFLSTIQIGITLIGILTGIYSGATLADDFSLFLSSIGVSQTVSHPLAQTIIVIVVTIVTIIFGELVPKRIGMGSPEKIAKVASGPMLFLSLVASPFVWLLAKSTQGIVKLFGIKNEDSKVTEEEIKSMIAEGNEDGEVQDVEQDIVERVFSLGDRKIETIMTSRNEIVWIDVEMSNEQINKIVQENLFEVYPVGKGSLDELVGVVFLKDLFGKLDQDGFNIMQIVKPIQYFHENMDVYKVLEQMKGKQVGYGLICDEFGVCQGIVTHKDILEGLVGAITDEEEEPYIIQRHDGEGWLVDGQCPFYDFLSHFEIEDLYSENDYNTISGLVIELLEHIPSTGESVLWYNFRFEIIDMDGARIDKLLVTKVNVQ